MKANRIKLDANTLIGTFGLQRQNNCGELNVLFKQNIQAALTENDILMLNIHRLRLETEGDFWNEEELKMNFLAHIFFIAQLTEPDKIQIFYERTLQATVENHEILVKCDCLLAKPFGVYEPNNPYFFLQEFKKQRNQTNDAEGQMLAAMMVAKHVNNNEKHVYGCYLQGKNWTFTLLQAQNYCVSSQLDATDPAHLQKIIYALRNIKKIILDELLSN